MEYCINYIDICKRVWKWLNFVSKSFVFRMCYNLKEVDAIERFNFYLFYRKSFYFIAPRTNITRNLFLDYSRNYRHSSRSFSFRFYNGTRKSTDSRANYTYTCNIPQAVSFISVFTKPIYQLSLFSRYSVASYRLRRNNFSLLPR